MNDHKIESKRLNFTPSGKNVITFITVGLCLIILTGFDFSKHSIPLDQIHDGGPPKDGIPALDDPEFIASDEAEYMNPKDRVLAINIDGDARAYPVRVLNWHELVNDVVGGKEILVSYCPLCGTGMGFETNLQGERFLFGVSGKLYNSDVLFYDRNTDSLWSQIKMEAVTGPMTGQPLTLLPLEHTTWESWTKKHPDTRVLSLQTGYSRDYSRNPYAGYDKSEQLFFPVNHHDNRLNRKSWVVGIVEDGEAKAWSFDRLKKEERPFQDPFNGRELQVHFDPEHSSALIKDERGRVVPSVQSYWFAWSAFYPETQLVH